MTKPIARESERAYSTAEAAAIKSVSEKTLTRAIKATEGNTLEAKRVGRGYRIKASDLDAWYEGLDSA
jgi:excisionase family DNA binding protein